MPQVETRRLIKYFGEVKVVDGVDIVSTDRITSYNVCYTKLLRINCLVFFIFQSNQAREYMAAEGYYFTSGLAEIEISRFIEYRNASADEPIIRNNFV